MSRSSRLGALAGVVAVVSTLFPLLPDGMAQALAQRGVGGGPFYSVYDEPVRGGFESIDSAIFEVPSGVWSPELEAALREPTTFHFHEVPLSSVIQHFANKHGIDIEIDTKALTDAGVNLSSLVTREIRRPISLESALRLTLDDFRLVPVVEHEVIMITTKETADEMLVTMVYPVSDLVYSRGSVNFGPLINMITTTIDPDSWDDNSGPGTAQPFMRPRTVLVISNRREIHIRVANLLATLRRSGGIVIRGNSATAYTAKTRTPQSTAVYASDAGLTQAVNGLYGAKCRVQSSRDAAESPGTVNSSGGFMNVAPR